MSASGTAFGRAAIHRSSGQRGYVIVTILVIVLITGILLSRTTRTTVSVEQTAGHAIQYTRAMEAAEGALAIAQRELIDSIGTRRFANASATDGVFSMGSVDDKWWKDSTFDGQHEVDAGMLLGVAESPQYVYEQIGEYVSDGGSGVVNMDIGGASYGRTSSSAREFIVYEIQARGVGSKSDIVRAIESAVIISK